ncbi:MAG TPA: hypothetical protein VFA57_15870 [Pseudolabrys sp.]|jgi:hypothetical protein|nr:hypothetical protein [Pseudolabrys sp.]
MKKVLASLLVQAVLATPALAQSFSVSPFGTGNVLPFAYGPVLSEKSGRNGLDALAKVPRGRTSDANSRENAGGGSPAYNQMLLTK